LKLNEVYSFFWENFGKVFWRIYKRIIGGFHFYFFKIEKSLKRSKRGKKKEE
jgi:hypothetical protein